ncbi:MAG: septum formation inhibitor Maf [Methylococcales bacterium]|nr:septum formation inhibitor Maf [Methylococcales bacterium]
MNPQLILASASPRRKELLDQIAVNCIIQPMDIDETPLPNEPAENYVIRIAHEKSQQCLNNNASNLPILAADTSVVINDIILGKPKNQDHAIEMLSLLSGKTHLVFSAISLRANGNHTQALSTTEVSFRKMSLKEIQSYYQTGEPQGKAGSYAIQGLGSIFVQSITGSFSGVMGLPLYETAELLSQQGIRVNR